MQTQPLRIDGVRLLRNLFDLARVGKTPDGTNRIAYSDADREGRSLAMELMAAAGLDIRVDTAANIIGRRVGTDPTLPAIVIGSHIDSVPNGGDYDGPVGSLSGIEVAHTLHEHGYTTRHPFEVVLFQNEEGGLFGSRLVSGAFEDRELDLVSNSGKTIREGITFLHGDPDRLDEAWRTRADVSAYLELHVEQGAVLEQANASIGIVEGIVGIGCWKVVVDGAANHAGTTPMTQRRDALLAAARFVEAVNRIVTAEPGHHVGTVGCLEAFPGAPNVIPGRVEACLELRDLDWQHIVALYERIARESGRIGNENQTSFTFKKTVANQPVPTDPRIRSMIAAAAQELGLTHRSLPSGAGHDAQEMARIAPVGMIFVPSAGGISHSPREFSRPEDIERGANVLLGTLLRLDS
ncbi:MAG TPA: Zn-dependent hydrolase [Gemmatimonadales bacterium]